jgi:hypothetical protein
MDEVIVGWALLLCPESNSLYYMDGTYPTRHSFAATSHTDALLASRSSRESGFNEITYQTWRRPRPRRNRAG